VPWVTGYVIGLGVSEPGRIIVVDHNAEEEGLAAGKLDLPVSHHSVDGGRKGILQSPPHHAIPQLQPLVGEKANAGRLREPARLP